MSDLDRLREAGLLKRDEITKLSEENMNKSRENVVLNEKLNGLNVLIERMENEKECKNEEFKRMSNENEDKLTNENMLNMGR